MTGVAPTRVAAQVAEATPPVPPGHWAYDVLDRLAAAGLLDDEWAVGLRPQSAGVMAAAFRNALIRGTLEGSPLTDFASTSVHQFAREYPEWHRPPGDGHVAVRELTLQAGRTTGGARRGTVGLGMDVTASLGRQFVLSYSPTVNAYVGGTASLEQPFLAAVAKLGRWWAGVGRQQLSFGPTTSGLIMNGASSFDGVLVGTDGAIRLGSIGRWLGPIHATALLSRFPTDTLGAGAWFGAARVALAPHPRVEIGLNRTAIVARSGERGTVGLRDLLFVAIGKHTRPNLEDQRASVDVSLALGSGTWRVVPYLELGFEDTAGAWVEDPGLTVGAYAPVLPGLPSASLRYEYTAFGDSARLCWFCTPRRTKWYSHGLRSAYAGQDGALMGHPLAGYGYEHRADAAAWLLGTRAHVQTTLLRRHREPHNLLYAVRPGDSHGIALGGSFRVLPGLTLDANASWEQGKDGWRERAASAGARVAF